MLFKDINLIEEIQKALTKSGYVTATPIQAQAIPHILNKSDLLGIAQTGTGKTAAFTLPILQLMFNDKKPGNNPRTLILAPTRELAAQIGESIREYGAFTGFRSTVIFGGVAQEPQVKALCRGIDIVVATPGRLLDLLQQRLVNLNFVEFLVLDEADRMLDMGFINDVKKIIAKLPTKKQTLFFSATMSKPISDLSRSILVNPKRVEVTPESKTIDKIEQGLYYVDTEEKNNLLLEMLNKKDVKSALVFTRTKHKANKIATILSKNGIPAEAIHGNKSQNSRTKTLNDFKSGRLKVLVATEIIARGIDIDNISHVINYEIPNEPESYVHRIGRTARAGTTGVAYSFCAADERDYIREIENIIKMEIPVVMHKKHSEFAQNATGSDAKPIPKSQLHNKGKSFQGDKAKSGKKKFNYGNKSKKFSKGSYKK